MTYSFRFLCMLALFVTSVLISETSVAAEAQVDDYITTKTYPCDGLVLISKERKSTPPLAIYALKIDLANRISVMPVNGKGKLFVGETPGDSYKRLKEDGYDVLANVNGDFWESRKRNYNPTSMFVNNGYIKHFSESVRSVLYFNDKVWDIGVPNLSAKFTDGAISMPIDDINPNTTGTKFALFTWNDPYFKRWNYTGKVVRLASPELLPNKEAKGIVLGDKTISCQSGLKLDSNEVFLASDTNDGKGVLEQLTSGSEIRLDVLAPGLNGVVTDALGGGPRLMRDGRISVEYEAERIGKDFSDTKHPRTAVGLDKERNTMWLVIVDGRQAKHSIGIGLEDLAVVMKDLGCYDAMNIDGGGSSSMYVKGNYINKPSDKSGPRAVCNGLAVIRTKK